MTPSLATLLTPSILLTILVIVSALAIGLLAWIIRLEIKLRRFTMGQSGASLEESFHKLEQHFKSTTAFHATTLDYLQTVEARLRNSIQGTETVRFNPFEGDGSGGNQSFATALLSETGNGVVFSSIYARDRMCVFAKPVKSFKSDHELSTEERDAIAKARHTLPQPSSSKKP